MQSISRRQFMQGTAALAAASAGAHLIDQTAFAQEQQPARRGGANERLNVAVIGVRGRGKSHIGGFANRHNCQVTHLCDCDEGVVADAMNQAQRQQNRRPTFVKDLRRIMDDNTIDIVAIATPNHWHALAAIWAMQSGKHVYVEKPVSHNVWEGRRIVEISRQTGKLCQAGTQIRSSTGVIEGIQFLRSGQLGRLQVARGLCYKPRGSIGTAPAAGGNIPNTIDYSLWCGPAPVQRPMRRQRLHYDWHWTWDYGNGDLGNQGIHQMDIARWGMGKNELCRSVTSVGGRFGYEDDGETANTQIAAFDYGDSQLIFEVRGLRTDRYRGAGIGNVFHCTEGYLVVPSYSSAIAYNNDGEVIRRFNGGGDHFGNLVSAIRNNRREELKGEILEGHLSSALCHLANISYRMGTPTPFNRRNAAFQGNEAASETFTRMREHLGANQVPLDNTNYMLGATLAMNPQTERFTNNDRANGMLTREYREGFVVPTAPANANAGAGS